MCCQRGYEVTHCLDQPYSIPPHDPTTAVPETAMPAVDSSPPDDSESVCCLAKARVPTRDHLLPGTAAWAHVDRDPPGSVVWVLFSFGSKIRVSYVRELQQTIQSSPDPVGSIILIAQVPLTPRAAQEFRSMGLFQTEYFLASTLSCNVTCHALVSPHSLIAPTNFPYNPADLPLLRQDDPIAKFLGFRPGDLVSIKRRSFFQQGQQYYRRVV